MNHFKFTKASIAALPPDPAGGRLEYRDTAVNGLILRVGASGVKSFCISRKRNGKFIRATLGRFPDLSIENARAKALELLGEVATNGKNPNDVRRVHAMSLISLEDALQTYIDNRAHRLKAVTAKQYRSILGNFSGDWMKQPMSNISRDRVEMRHKAITQGGVWFGKDKSLLRAGVGSGSKAQADLWARALRAVYRFSYDHYRDEEGKTLLPDPPTMVLSTKRQWHGTVRKTERIRTSDLGRWLKAVEQVRQESMVVRDDVSVSICDALDMALFTGLRRTEVFGLEWNRVNIGGRYFWIDTTKNGDPLELPITDTLLAIFRRRLHLKNGEQAIVFNGKKGMVKEPRRVIRRIVAATVPESNPDELAAIEFKCHDARRTYGTVAELAGVGPYILKRLMNHRTLRSADVTQGYLHFGADELMEPSMKVERAILEYAGLVEKAEGINAHLLSALANMSDEDKRRLLFDVMNNQKVKNES
ncbi:integrase family protein [Yersinia enterocolitica]|uniref:integrase family protein n=1 Tax=Yersinia intermedia TaxID=631 RepID=UPI000B724AED|nr:integrase family protein [Yersinia intermedia]EME3609784.1 integrase family protein [Yersinia enterocolitica]MCW8113962.1 integrase family protein [Yersinia intermedia]MDA5518806.1 integrase family protein [Yersinia intermedia]OWF92909.1 integrase [Yersinia intermedia]